SAGQRINIVLQELNGAFTFVAFVAHTLQVRDQQPERPKLGELALDAMVNLEPGDIVDAWLSFDGIPGTEDLGRAGKTRPAIFIAKRGDFLLLRGITDGESSYAQRLGTPAIRDWKQAGLKKPSVVMAHDQEVEIADVWVRRGRLTDYDRRNLRIA
ncbi:MAG: PemK-like, MazF-like toxin of type toxin-antitoxin system, partial [Actinomycetota bacterium]